MIEQDDAFARVWEAFVAGDLLVDGRHDTAPWRSHAGPFAFCMIRIPASALEPALTECRDALAGLPDLRMHPDHFLHISLQEIGFLSSDPDSSVEVSPTALEEFVSMAAAAISERAPFMVTLQGLNSFQDAVFLEVHDEGDTQWLHQRLYDMTSSTNGATYAFLPHVTLAHYTGPGDHDAAVEAIAPLRSIPVAELAVSEIEVVTLATGEAYPDLTKYAVIPLRG